MYYPKVRDFIIALILSIIFAVLLFAYKLFADMWYFLAIVPVVMLGSQIYLLISQRGISAKNLGNKQEVKWKKKPLVTATLVIWILVLILAGEAKTGLDVMRIYGNNIYFIALISIFVFIYFLWFIVSIQDLFY